MVMKMSLIVLLCFSGCTFAENGLVSREEIWRKPAPAGWESSPDEGDINGDGKKDTVVWIYKQSSVKNNSLEVYLQTGNNLYKEVFKGEYVMSDPGLTYRIIYPRIINGRLTIFAQKTNYSGSERFTFDYRNEHFILMSYGDTYLNQKCTHSVSYRWTDRVEPIPLEKFSIEYFKKEYFDSSVAYLVKDFDFDLEKQYQGLLTSFKTGDKNGLSEAVIRDIVGFDEMGKRCMPDNYMERYLFLNDVDKVGVSNDIAFFLEQTGYYDEAIWLLNKIVSSYPERTVAYLNLGDAYWGKGNKNQAKHAYRKYVELMKTSGKEGRIPKRVTTRLAQ